MAPGSLFFDLFIVDIIHEHSTFQPCQDPTLLNTTLHMAITIQLGAASKCHQLFAILVLKTLLEVSIAHLRPQSWCFLALL